MPQYVDDSSVPRFGRRRAKDIKIYHTRKCIYGPTLISKFVWNQDSDYQWYNHYDAQLGLFKKDQHIYPSLVAASKLPLPTFDHPYSVNKHRRWEIMAMASKSIKSFQRPDVELRVTVLDRVLPYMHRYVSVAPENTVGYVACLDKLSAVHFCDAIEHKEVHLHAHNMTLGDLLYRDHVNPVKKKRRFRRRKYPHLIAKRKTPKPVADDQRRTHIFITQHSFNKSIRQLNMQRFMIPSIVDQVTRAYNSRRKNKKLFKEKKKRHEPHRRSRYHEYGGYRSYELCKKDICVKKCALKKRLLCEIDDDAVEMGNGMSLGSDITEFDHELDRFDDTENVNRSESYDETFEWKPRQLSLGDFLEVLNCKQEHKDSLSKKMQPVEQSAEYDCWLHSSPAKEALATDVEESEQSHDVNNNEIEIVEPKPLTSFIVDLSDEQQATYAEKDVAIIAERLMPRSNELFGIIPPTFFSSLNDISEELRSLLPKLNDDHLAGFIFMNRISNTYAENITLRFILNSADDTSEAEESSSSYSLKLQTSLSRFIPSDYFVSSSTIYKPQFADKIACDQLLSESRYKCADLPSTSFAVSPPSSSYCAICDSETDDGFSLRCSHRFCRECWTKHASSAIASGIAPVKCPAFQCNESLNVDHILMLLPMPSYNLYKRMLSNKCMLKPNWLQCSNCSNVLCIDALSSSQYLIHCECGNILCVRCKQNVHPGLSCDQARQYFEIIHANGQFSHIFNDDRNVMVKRCPFCGTFCERSEGCNHMICTCGEAFCYVCGGKWNQGNHYECDVDVSVRVYMFDVSDVNIGYISMKTLDECLEYRRLKSATNLWTLQKKLMTILGDNPAEVRRTISLYSTICEVLELNAQSIYHLRRHLRHARNAWAASRLQMLLGALGYFKQRFDFQLKRLLMVCDCKSTKSDKIAKICCCVEDALTEYMREVL